MVGTDPEPARPRALRWATLIFGSAALAILLHRVHSPAAFLLGPLIVAAGMALSGAAVRQPAGAMLAAQAVVGGAIAMSTTMDLWLGVAARWPVYLALAATTLAVTTMVGWIMTRREWMAGTSAIWGLAPGASTAMILMSDRFGGDPRQVALMQYLRILMVVAAAIGLAHARPDGAAHTPASWFAVADVRAFAGTVLLLGLCAGIGRASRLPAGVLLAPMLVGGLVQAMGWLDLTLPPILPAIAYAVIGSNIGLQFTREAVRHGAEAAPRMVVAILIVLAGCAATAWVVHVATGIDWLSAYLAASPGGTDTILIIAVSTPVDLAFILGAQLVRFLLVLLVGPLVARAASRAAPPAPATP